MLATTTHPVPPPTPGPHDPIVAGIDTHKNTHHVAVLSMTGALIADTAFAATSSGYRQLLDWVRTHGQIDTIGIEGTSSYGAGLTRHLNAAGIRVVAVPAADKAARARRGKTDQLDAIDAARAVLAGTATAIPKDTTGSTESIRILSTTRDSAIKARTAAINAFHALLITAPAVVGEAFTGLTRARMLAKARNLHPDPDRAGEPQQAARLALRRYARRITALDTEITDADREIRALVTQAAPHLLAADGIGPHTAAQFLTTAASNIDRISGEAAFARLCGAAPIPVSSGNTHRMRLHRGGDRQANRALHMIVVGRLRRDPDTQAYRDRKLQQGHSKKDAIRCLKRYIAREVYYLLRKDLLVP